MTAIECAQLKELWQERIKDFRASGLSSREWCAQQGLKVDRLHYWNRKLQPTDAAASAAWVTLETARVSDPYEESLVVTVGFDPGFLQSLVRALAALVQMTF